MDPALGDLEVDLVLENEYVLNFINSLHKLKRKHTVILTQMVITELLDMALNY